MSYVPFHALAAFLSGLLALVCGFKSWSHSQERKNQLVKYLAFVFFSEALAMLSLVPPALFFQSQLLPPFLAASIFFQFLGIAFFSQITVSLFSQRADYRALSFVSILLAGIFLTVFTLLSKPSLSFAGDGLFTVYHLPPVLRLFVVIFTIIITSFLSGLVFILKGFTSLVFLTKIRSVFFGLALLFIGAGISLTLLGESFYYNFFIILAFLCFYLSVSLRKRTDRFYGKV